MHLLSLSQSVVMQLMPSINSDKLASLLDYVAKSILEAASYRIIVLAGCTMQLEGMDLGDLEFLFKPIVDFKQCIYV